MDGYRTVIEGIPGRVSWWRLGETTGTDAADEESTQKGVYQGGVTLDQAPLPADTDNPDAAFDGATGYIEVKHNAAYTTLANGTIAIWFRPASLTGNATLLSKDLAGINVGDLIFWYVQSSDQLRLQIDDGSQQHQVNATGVLSPNTTYCAVISWGSAGMKMFLASGGALQLVGTNPYTGGLDSNSQDLQIGATQFTGAPADFFPGTIGDVIMWNSQLSDPQIESVTQASLSAYEPKATSLSPAIYLTLNEGAGSTTFADSSGGNRSGSLNGTASAYNVAALPSGTAGNNGGLNLGSSAWISVAHAAADTALTFPLDWKTEQSTAGYRIIADCTVSIWFKPNSLPTGDDKHVIVAKSSSETPGTAASYAESPPILAAPGSTVNGGSWEAYIDSNGAVHVEVRSFRGRPCRIRTPNGAVAAGTTYHLVVQLSYDGVAAWLNGAKFEDGYANLLHVYGLCANIRNIVFRNNYDWTIGKAAWGGQADLIVDEFAIYLKTLTTTNAQSLAQSGSVAPLAHHIWGARTVNESSYAGTAGTTQRIQNAIADVNGSGGGTVLINPGTYNGNITMASNVRLKANGGTVNINGRCTTPVISVTALSVGTGDFMTGDKTLTTPNTRLAGDIVFVGGREGDPSPDRQERRWCGATEGNDRTVEDSQLFEIESRTSSNMTFVGDGSLYDFPAVAQTGTAQRDEVYAYTPHQWVALEGDLRFSSNPGNGHGTIELNSVKHVRIVGGRATNTASGAVGGFALLFFSRSLYGQVRDFTNIQATLTTGSLENDGLTCWFGASNIIFKDCDCFEGRHGADAAGGLDYGVCYRDEWHNCTWTNTNSRGANGSIAAIGTHGGTCDCIYWNFTSNWGGPNVTGWKHDARWMVCGDPATAGSGFLAIEDGAGDCYFRDWHLIRPSGWFDAFENAIGVERCHFRNVTWSQTPTGDQHDSRYRYGTGANVNTYNNVDGRHASWTEV